ncbi:MAG: DUF2087 domain-containing protein [Aggregatilineales bacterium]
MDDAVKPYLDAQGRVTRWPARRNRSDRAPLLAYFTSKFESGKIYTEREVNEILKAHHTFDDWALLRREMVMQGIFGRSSSGSQYWLEKQPDPNLEYTEQEF